MTARFSADDYASAARALAPRGPAWANDPASVQGKTLAALALTLWRSDAAAVQLLADAYPGSTTALIDEWEASVGLTAPAGATIEQRRSRVLSRLIGTGGQSRSRFITFAAALGFTITIENFAPLRVGQFSAGAAVYGLAWASAWRVRITASQGLMTPTQLKAELDAIRPAETIILI